MEGNLLSTLVFFAWVPLVLRVLQTRRTDPAFAVAALMLGGIMFLPEGVRFKLPGVPHFDKAMITSIWVFAGLFLFHRQRVRALALGPAAIVLMCAVPVAAMLTALTNREPLAIGPTALLGMTPWDGVHLVIIDFTNVVLPFLIGAIAFRTRNDARNLLVAVAGAGLVYTPFILYEVRFSPLLHYWTYGFSQHDFLQTLRWGGYRPMVYMNHGIAVALLIATSVLAVVALSRLGATVRGYRTSRVGPLLTWILVLCKTVGSWIYAGFGWLLLALGSARAQIAGGILLVSILLAYPIFRLEGLVPTSDLVASTTDWVNEERAQSLEFRLLNEEVLFERALERISFGWGGMGRACVYDRWTGDEIAVRDGAWIITLGERGAFGFIVLFGFMAISVYGARRALPNVAGEADRLLLGAVATLVAVHAFDLIPNGRYSYFCDLYAGALYGLSSGMPAEALRLRRSRAARSRTASMETSSVPAAPEAARAGV